MSPLPRLRRALAPFALFVASPLIGALVDDLWSDGNRTSGAPDSPWYFAGGGSLTASVGAMTLTVPASGSAPCAWTCFTATDSTGNGVPDALSLAPGDSLRVTVSFTTGNLGVAGSSTRRDLRFGLFNLDSYTGGALSPADGTSLDNTGLGVSGYMLQLCAAGTFGIAPIALGHHDPAQTSLTGGFSAANYPDSVTGPAAYAGQGLASNTAYVLTYTVAHAADAGGVSVTATLSGGTLSGITLTYVDTTAKRAAAFNAFALRSALNNGTNTVAGSLTLTRFQVEHLTAAPAITSTPVSCAANPGGTATFSVAATGGPLSYQWRRDGAVVPGATAASLTLTNVQLADAGWYSVDVTNSGGTTTSPTAALTVTTLALPAIPAAVFNAAAYGVVGDGTTDNTAAIQATIAAALAAGGGTVNLPTGTVLSGPLTLGNNLHLHLPAGCTLTLLPYGTYPGTADFLTASGVHDVKISGPGVIEGQGSPWWAAYEATAIARPKTVVAMVNCTRALLEALTVRNPPNTHASCRSASNTVVLAGVTFSAPGNSPNTDGIDVSAQNVLIDRCRIAVGDDNIALSSSNYPIANVEVSNCAFGVGHGMSIGSYTYGGGSGVKNLLVHDCTFTGTTAGIRMKSDTDRGGSNENLVYRNLTMTGVAYPLMVDSYYANAGTTGSPNSNGTPRHPPADAAAWNSTPPMSLTTGKIPVWKNVLLENITSTGATGYSVIWGLPLASAFAQDFTLRNVHFTGAHGLQIYNATGIRLGDSSTITSGDGTAFITYNALAITSQPQNRTVNAGGTTTFSVTTVGNSGVNNTSPTFRWYRNGTALSDGLQPGGSTVAGATTATLTLSNVRRATAGSFAVVASNALDVYDPAGAALVPSSANVTVTSSAAALIVPDPYAQFVTAAGLDLASNGAPDADPDADGLANLLEFALGGDPVTGSPGVLPTVAFDGTALQFSFRLSRSATAADVAIAVQTSADLATWTEVTVGQNGVTETILPIDAATDLVTVSIPTAAPRFFVRLNAMR